MGDFNQAEFEARLERAQIAMRKDNIDALFFSTEAEVRYFSGFRTLFWQSPTRPWYLVIPQKGGPIAIIPGIGAELMGKNWIEDIRTWSSPHPSDDGVSLLCEALKGHSRVGMPMGQEGSLRMPLLDFEKVRASCDAEFVDCTPIVLSLIHI